MNNRVISILLLMLLIVSSLVGCKKKEDRLSGPYDVNNSYTDEIDGTTTSENTVEVDLETGKVISMPGNSTSKTEIGKEQVGEDDLPSKTTDSKSSSSAGSSSSDKSNSSSSSSSSSSGKDNSSSSSSDDNKQSMDGWEPWR